MFPNCDKCGKDLEECKCKLREGDVRTSIRDEDDWFLDPEMEDQ